MWNNQKQQKKLFSRMSNLQTYYHFKLDFQKVEALLPCAYALCSDVNCRGLLPPSELKCLLWC